jgi:hypothetical protein
VSAGDVLISEFRTRGPDGEQDEFVELYNNTDHPITVQAPDGSGGWTITSLTSDGSSVTVPFTINDGTTLPPRGHYLGASSPFFMGGYGLTNYAVPDNFLGAVGGGLADFTGIALFKTATPANRTLANRLDAVGFTGPTGPLANLHREGVGLTPADSSNQSSFVRRMLTGLAQDTNDNASDFVFVTTGLNGPSSVRRGRRICRVRFNATRKSKRRSSIRSRCPPRRRIACAIDAGHKRSVRHA